MGVLADIGSLGESLFGKDVEGEAVTNRDITKIGRADITGKQTEQLVLDSAAVQKIIEDVLSAEEGLASIFSGEQNAGIFNSSVAEQQAQDLVTSIVGELAKLTGKTVIDQQQTQKEEQTSTERGTSETESESGGLFGKLFG